MPMRTDARLPAQELMDDPACGEHELRQALRDLARINRSFGAHAFVRAYLDRALPVWRAHRAHATAPLRVLDVATGGGDVPAATARWAARRGVDVRVVAVDRHPTIVRLAREATARHPDISVVLADARALPFAAGSFDVGVCTLALHHMSDDDSAILLRELHRLARIGFLAVDLVRGRAGHTAVWLMTRLSRSALIRHDGPLSVRRARSVGEYRQLVQASGVPGLRVSTLPLFRVSLTRLE
ncbi:MAG TPA: methyltransferase domain-containing protein [bacterium]|nr:methyltransferase domain-containing protein [bacterium]